jgi:hypothetical protein
MIKHLTLKFSFDIGKTIGLQVLEKALGTCSCDQNLYFNHICVIWPKNIYSKKLLIAIFTLMWTKYDLINEISVKIKGFKVGVKHKGGHVRWIRSNTSWQELEV